MSRHHDQLLGLICNNKATFVKAKAILHTASLKTIPGSGYDIGPGASGLPAICAYIAADECVFLAFTIVGHELTYL